MPVLDRDLGFDDLQKLLEEIDQPRVLVGILQDKGAEYVPGEDITLAGYAAVNEFGSEDGHVPERSFLRSTVDENTDKYGTALEKASGAAVDEAIRSGVGAGLRRLERDLGQLGAVAAGDVQDKIRSGVPPENAPSTLAAKYPANKTLIHTGRMRQSITFKVEMDVKVTR